ncbi:MAG: response regulator [Oscillochloridaceae bacterium umkhey_bin13]
MPASLLPQRDVAQRSPTILIGDDDLGFRQLLAIMLTDAGFQVLSAGDGSDLVRLAQEGQPDLLLIDLMMPSLDGYEVLRQLRSDTRTAHLPMIILTALNSAHDFVSGFESGADDYVTKPVRTDELLARIRSHLRRAARHPVRSPLTGLPGNRLLEAEIRHRQERYHPFMLLHADLSAFKVFNDTYGFARGDQAIIRLAAALRRTIEAHPHSELFLGHIGGDDFAILCPPALADALSHTAVIQFAAEAEALYDPADWQRGYLVGRDRDGIQREFTLMTLIIGGAAETGGRFANPEELSRCAAAMKQLAKQRPISTFALSFADAVAPLIGP